MNETSKNMASYARTWTDLKKEFRLISWTPTDQLISYTKIVLWSAVIMGFAIYITDLFIGSTITQLQNLIYLLFS